LQVRDHLLRYFERDTELRLFRRRPEVRSDDHLGVLHDFREARRLFWENVEADPADLAGIEAADQSRLVEEAASGCVDEKDALLHLRDGRVVHDPYVSAVIGV
jgi:hypothetical protein